MTFLVQARSAVRDVWIQPRWEGKPALGPWHSADGRDVVDLIAGGDLDQISFPVWFQAFGRGTRWGDMLWTGGLPCKVASTRFVAVLESIGATGWRTFEVDLRAKGGDPVPGYLGIATTGPGDDLDVTHLFGFQNLALRVKRHVLEALLGAGVDQFDHEPLDE
ncbi:hypothetical protein [Cellulomonas bogoriensis]|uniref:Uncharacterized protein n=1 Tax=Cellulomonas bogoriensis 69B4 = DSM 16987 TaxID=1386082 RepID=A0A0A0C2L2_9CELL|nr:hypothetical protein [Cellulomonas bogoriensis]KGM14425.1 hypothetical protein N869_11025 [Cellulomonas bogoriensis 69B4 = DSM 16987]